MVRQIDQASDEHARSQVRPAALAMLTVGCLGLCANLFMAVFGFIDDWMAPLSSIGEKE